MNHTKGKWEAKDIPSHGWEIFAEVNMGKDENGGVVQPIYNVDIKPYIRVGDDGIAYVMIAYESWRQFPSVNFKEMQEANAHLIAASPVMLQALVEVESYLENRHPESYRQLEIVREALAKAKGKEVD